MPIPTTVRHADVMEALKPLCDLLGTSVNNYFADPGITIRDGEITFTAAAANESDPAGRAPAILARPGGELAALPAHPQGLAGVAPVLVPTDGDEYAEYGFPIVVRVEMAEEVA